MLAALATPALAADPPDSGVKGHVTAGPQCPVEPYPPDPSCDYAGFQTTVRVRKLPGRKLVKVVHTGKRGGFTTRLGPGRYRLRPHDGENGFPRCQPQDLTVEPHRFTHVTLTCDTGIR